MQLDQQFLNLILQLAQLTLYGTLLIGSDGSCDDLQAHS
jgi:hypothetical protein